MKFRKKCLYKKHVCILTHREGKEERETEIYILLLKKGKGGTGEECQDDTLQLGQGSTMLKNNIWFLELSFVFHFLTKVFP